MPMLPTGTVQQVLKAARAQLAQFVPVDEASIEAQWLLMHVLGVNRAWLIAHGADALASEAAATFAALVQRRLQGEPVAHILGKREFFGLALKVTPDTLIPRPDTETLVEAALAKINGRMRVLDLGTGTGAVALAIARHAPACEVVAVDASAAALAVAAENANALKLEQVQCLLSDWFSALAGARFDLIVSNPPYIESNDYHLQQGDLRFEPITALASGLDGLDDLRHIVAQAPAHLTPGGWLMLEHGYNQAEAVKALLNAQGFCNVQTLKDLGSNPRVTLGQSPTD